MWYWNTVGPLAQGAVVLSDKTLQLAVTTGSKVEDYQADGRHNFTLEEYLRPFEQTAKLCHMTWRQAFWVPATHGISASSLASIGPLSANC